MGGESVEGCCEIHNGRSLALRGRSQVRSTIVLCSEKVLISSKQFVLMS